MKIFRSKKEGRKRKKRKRRHFSGEGKFFGVRRRIERKQRKNENVTSEWDTNKQDHLRMNNGTRSNNHLRSIDR